MKDQLKYKSIEVEIYGSASNGLFDVPSLQEQVDSADLDLTVLIEGSPKSSKDILQQIYLKLNKESKQGSSSSSSRKGKVIEVTQPMKFSAGFLLEKVKYRLSFEEGGEKKMLNIEVDILVNKYLEMLNS